MFSQRHRTIIQLSGSSIRVLIIKKDTGKRSQGTWQGGGESRVSEHIRLTLNLRSSCLCLLTVYESEAFLAPLPQAPIFSFP